MPLYLRDIVRNHGYDNLPAQWRRTNLSRFSPDKKMRDYQQTALENAASAMHLYFSGGRNTKMRKHAFCNLYRNEGCDLTAYDITRWDNLRRGKIALNENPVFDILRRGYAIHRQENTPNQIVPFADMINRMSFWMATGSGKTLVMIKLAEMLAMLMDGGVIPRRDILVLAPRDDLLQQTQTAVDEFNRNGEVFFDWTPLNRYGEESPSLSFGKSTRLYYWRSDNIAEEGREARVDYRNYENDGKWYVLLDEAHKGGKANSRRQAYYSLLSRDGFLFNFSATFTDDIDMATGVCKYNLQDFVGEGYGKHILLSHSGFGAFRTGANKEIDKPLRREILLKSLLTLAFAKMRVRAVRKTIGRADLYHEPLMMTLVNSVNTAEAQNDLWAFFSLLRDIATGGGDAEQLLNKAKTALAREWQNPDIFFESTGVFTGDKTPSPEKMTLAQLREMVFHSRKPSALHVLDPGNGKELAFQLNGASSPFAMLRIGDIGKWKNDLLANPDDKGDYLEIQKTPLGGDFFAQLENGRIGILMGSRSFVEGWDSNRPNVINFVNIGVGEKAKKFVAQAIGRGVRIESVKGIRRRLSHLEKENTELHEALSPAREMVAPVETVFVYATNRSAVSSVLAALNDESIGGGWRPLDGFEENPLPLLHNNEKMPLLKPEYRQTPILLAKNEQLPIGNTSAAHLQSYLQRASDAHLILSQRFLPRQAADLRASAQALPKDGGDKETTRAWLHKYRLHSSIREKEVDKIHALSPDDIVHFHRIETNYAGEEFRALETKIKTTAKSGRREELRRRLKSGEIDIEEYDRLSEEIGKDQSSFDGYDIRRIAEHYYSPVVSANASANDERQEQRIRHIIKMPGEVRFVRELAEWLKNNNTGWDKWMFSKVDESLDRIFLPYYDARVCDYARFFPDFVFWMQDGNNYRIVFVDPKGMEHSAYLYKTAGYEKLFEEDGGRARVFSFRHSAGAPLRISVKLVLYNKNARRAPPQTKRFWHATPDVIFAKE